jgi:DNA-binding CsgD family transcriptional regulator
MESSIRHASASAVGSMNSLSIPQVDGDMDNAAALESANSVQILLRRINNIVVRAGFDFFQYAAYENRAQLKNECGTDLKCLREIRNLYALDRLYECDWFIDELEATAAPVFFLDYSNQVRWLNLRGRSYEMQKRIISLYHDRDIFDFCRIPIASTVPSAVAYFTVGCFGVKKDIRKLLVRQFDQLEEISKILHTLATTKFVHDMQMPDAAPRRAGKSNAAVISGAPLKLLNYIATHNCTLYQAAEGLGIGIGTANGHIRTAKNLLGANSTVFAVVKAIQLGLIDIDT